MNFYSRPIDYEAVLVGFNIIRKHDMIRSIVNVIKSNANSGSVEYISGETVLETNEEYSEIFRVYWRAMGDRALEWIYVCGLVPVCKRLYDGVVIPYVMDHQEGTICYDLKTNKYTWYPAGSFTVDNTVIVMSNFKCSPDSDGNINSVISSLIIPINMETTLIDSLSRAIRTSSNPPYVYQDDPQTEKAPNSVLATGSYYAIPLEESRNIANREREMESRRMEEEFASNSIFNTRKKADLAASLGVSVERLIQPWENNILRLPFAKKLVPAPIPTPFTGTHEMLEMIKQRFYNSFQVPETILSAQSQGANDTSSMLQFRHTIQREKQKLEDVYTTMYGLIYDEEDKKTDEENFEKNKIKIRLPLQPFMTLEELQQLRLNMVITQEEFITCARDLMNLPALSEGEIQSLCREKKIADSAESGANGVSSGNPSKPK
jgi:hypothetical protein